MNAKQRGKLVDALLGCPSVSNRNTRNTLVGNLYEDIQRNIQRSDADREDVANIVRTCLNYSNGLEEFIAVVRRYEGTSIPMEAVDSLILDIYDLDVLPSARPMHIQLLSTISDIEVPSDELKQVYRSILPEGVEESAEPLGLFAITSHLWNLSLRPEGQRKDRAYPVIDWIEELARRTADSGLATGLRNWANRVAPELDQQARQRQRPGQPAVAAETQGQMELDLRLTILASVLSFLYPTVEDSGEIVAKSRLNPVNIDFRDNAFRNWLNILNEARERARVRAIIDTALTDHAGNEWLRLASREQELEETRR